MRANFPLQDRGFTLIEVLVALVVVALGMLGVIQTVSQTASNSTYMRDKTIAHWVAMNQLTQARLQPAAPKVDKSSDEVEMAGRKWRWTMEVQQTPVESIRRIDVQVRLEDAPDGSSIASVSGFYGAAVAPPGTTLINWQGSQAPGAGSPRDEESEGTPPQPREPEPGEPEPGEPVESPPVPEPE